MAKAREMIDRASSHVRNDAAGRARLANAREMIDHADDLLETGEIDASVAAAEEAVDLARQALEIAQGRGRGGRGGPRGITARETVELPIVGEVPRDALIVAGVAGGALLLLGGSSESTSSTSSSTTSELPDPGDFDSWSAFSGAVRRAGGSFEQASELWSG